MSNHVHLLLTPEHPNGLSLLMRDLGRRYVQQYINPAYRRSGTLWEGRYKSSLVDTRNYFLTCCRYIELNPVRAGMVPAPQDYPWSSYRHHGFGVNDSLVSPHPEYVALGATPLERQRAYRSLFTIDLSLDELHDIRDTVNRGWPLAREHFADEIEAVLKRAARPPRRGRPARTQHEPVPGPD